MPFISLQDQGYFNPGAVVQDSVANYVQNQVQRQRMQQQQQQFHTDQTRREAENAPVVDPQVVAKNIEIAIGKGASQADIANFIASQPPTVQMALNQGQIPQQTVTKPSYDPSGRLVTTTNTGIQTGQDQQGNPIYQPFKGSSAATPPALGQTATIGNENPTAPGLAPTTTTEFFTDEKGVRHQLPPKTTITRTGRTSWQQSTMGMMTAAQQTLANPDSSPEEKALAQKTIDAAQGLINKGSATAPVNPNLKKTNAPTTALERSGAQVLSASKDYQAALATGDEAKIAEAGQIFDMARENRKKLLASKPDPMARLAAMLADKPGDQTNRPGIVNNNKVGPGAGPSDYDSTHVQEIPSGGPSRSGGKYSPPPTPRSTAQGGKFVQGQVYRDSSGNRARWNGTGWDEL